MQYIHAMEYYPALKRKEMLMLQIRMSLEDAMVMLNELSQSQKNWYCMISGIPSPGPQSPRDNVE